MLRFWRRCLLFWLIHMILIKLWSCCFSTCFQQSSGNSSALFLTAAAQNLLCLKLAEELGVIITSPWVLWFKAACVPAFVSLLATPLVLYKLYPPETKDTPEAPAMAAKKLENMGPVTKNEWIMVGTMLLAVSLWVSGYEVFFLGIKWFIFLFCFNKIKIHIIAY